MISIITKTISIILIIIIILYFLPTFLYLFLFFYFGMVYVFILLIGFVIPKKYRGIVFEKFISLTMGKKETLRNIGFFLGRWTNALQRDWLPKLVGGERIARLLIESSRSVIPKFEIMINAFVEGSRSARENNKK